MTIINPNSIAGITSVTAEAGVMNFYKSDGTLAGLQLNGVNFNTATGVSTFNNLYVGGVLTYEDVKNVDSVGIITARDGVHIDDSITHIGDTNTKIRFPAADTISIETGGVTRATVTGNNIDFPDAGTLRFGASNDLQIYHGTGGASNIIHSNTSQPLIINATGAGAIRLDTNSNERLRITSAGQVKIGSDSYNDNSSRLVVMDSNQEVLADDEAVYNNASKSFVTVYNNHASGNGQEAGINFVPAGNANGAMAIYGKKTGSYAGDMIFRFRTGSGTSAERLRITSGGNIGVGVDAPTFSSINSITANSARGIEIFKNGTDTGSAIKLAGDNGSGTKAWSQLGYSGANGTAHWANYNTAGTEVGRIQIGSTGNIGIGNRTSNPGELLHVHTASGAAVQEIEGATDATLILRSHSGDSYIKFADAASSNIGRIDYDHGTDAMIFRTNSDPRLTITSGGCVYANNFGIGTDSNWKIRANTSNTDLAFEYSTSSSLSDNNIKAYFQGSSTDARLIFRKTETGSCGLEFRNGTTQKAYQMLDSEENMVYLAQSGVHHRFYTGGSTESFRINNTGVVQVTSERLTLGTSVTNGGANDGNLCVEFSSASRNAVKLRDTHNTGSTTYMVLVGGSATVGSITGTTGQASYNNLSDYRSKENDVKITDGIAKLKLLRPIRFNYKTDSSTLCDGFFAHEVTPAVPTAVTGEKDVVDSEGKIDAQMLDTSKMVPLLTAAIQEAIAKIETLEAEVASLKSS